MKFWPNQQFKLGALALFSMSSSLCPRAQIRFTLSSFPTKILDKVLDAGTLSKQVVYDCWLFCHCLIGITALCTLKKWRTFKTFCMINYDTRFSSKMLRARNLAIGVIGNLLPFSLALAKAFAAIGDLTSLFLGPPSITQTNWSHCLPNHHHKLDGHFKQKSKAPFLRKKSRN